MNKSKIIFIIFIITTIALFLDALFSTPQTEGSNEESIYFRAGENQNRTEFFKVVATKNDSYIPAKIIINISHIKNQSIEDGNLIIIVDY